MHPLKPLFRAIVVPILFGLALSACALGRSVVEVSPTPIPTATESKGFARIVEVRDLRQFTENPRDPSSPSLSSASDIGDPKITSRAIGRKRGGFGAAFGDVVLPEGQTVSELVRGAATRALQERGYAVVDQSSPNYAAALPLALDIEQFWAWFTPGFFEVTVEFKAAVDMRGDTLVGAPDTANAYATYGTVAVFESTWAYIVATGLDDLVGKMKEHIKAPGVAENGQPKS